VSYEAQAALTADPLFVGRLGACVTTESRSKDDDLAELVLTAGAYVGVSKFMPYVSSEPGFDVPQDQITDPMLLSAVQSVWPLVLADLTAQ
jgi:hypothetical protein